MLELAQQKIKKQKKNEPQLKKKNKIYFFIKNFKTRRSTKKLDYIKIGPFLVTKIFLLKIFRIQLPLDAQIKLIFDLSFLSVADLKILLATIFKYKNKKKIEFKIDKIIIKKSKKYLVS